MEIFKEIWNGLRKWIWYLWFYKGVCAWVRSLKDNLHGEREVRIIDLEEQFRYTPGFILGKCYQRLKDDGEIVYNNATERWVVRP